MMEVYKNKSLENMPNEKWAYIPFYNREYMVSDYGRVKSVSRSYIHPMRGIVYVEEKILSQIVTKLHGYCRCQISVNKKKSKWYVHRLVGITFLDNNENKPQINHKNGVRTDNRVENLEWATASENNQHAYDKLGKVGAKAFLGKVGSLHHASKKVICVTLGMTFESAKIAGRVLGVSQGSISHVCNNKRNNAEGLYFRYI